MKLANTLVKLKGIDCYAELDVRQLASRSG